MAVKQIALDVAAFLDSDHGRAVPGPREEVKRVAEIVVESCYDGLGKSPRLIDAEDMRALVIELLPRRFAKKDSAAEQVPPLLEAWIEHVAATEVMSQAFEVRRALGPACERFLELVRSGHNLPEAPVKQTPFVHGAPKLGRNDPCSCGSGKKFKKCHGKGA